MDVATRLDNLRERIATACQRVGRDPASVTLLAVSKGQPPAAIQSAAGAGLTLFGENRVQEAKAKIGQCPGRLHWHLIGHLQTNKARDAVHFFDLIQSLDSLHVAQELEKWAARAAKTLPVLLEVNVAGEASKHGYAPADLLTALPAINALPHLAIHGLMTLAPWSPDPERARPVFRRLRALKDESEAILGAPLPHLSMGMSGDFETAIEEGATLIRIGTALFGERPTPPREPRPVPTPGPDG